MKTAAHRGLIVADGYYEWQKPEDPKQPRQPFYHRLPGGELFAFAGLWTTATSKDAEEPVTSCSIITTAANRDVRFVHDRMPVILDGPEAEAAWLDPGVDLDGALELVRPLPDGRLEVYAVSSRVNNARNQDVDLTEAADGGSLNRRRTATSDRTQHEHSRPSRDGRLSIIVPGHLPMRSY